MCFSRNAASTRSVRVVAYCASGAQAHRRDLAIERVELDAIADLEGPIDDERHAGEDRRGEILQREADGDRDSISGCSASSSPMT